MGINLEYVLEFKYLGCNLDKSATDGAECSRKVASGKRIAGAIRSLVDARDLQLGLIFLHCLYLLLCMAVKQYYGRRLERSRIRAVQMDNLRGLLGIRRMNRVLNARIRELYEVKKGLDEKIDEGVLQWFGDLERNRIANRVYVGECAGSHSVGRLWKRWIDAVMDVRQARRMVQDRSEWQGFVRGNACSVTQGDEHLTLKRSHSCGLPQTQRA